MRFLLQTLPRVSRCNALQSTTHQTHASIRAFSGARTLRLKEDKDERSGQEIEKQKQEQLKKGSGWNKELASSSEEVVGADQEKVRDHDAHMDKLQKETAQKSEEKHPEGKS